MQENIYNVNEVLQYNTTFLNSQRKQNLFWLLQSISANINSVRLLYKKGTVLKVLLLVHNIQDELD